ncbi:ribonuclease P protein component [Methylophilaceae bacterium]|nr:ribonuclease P protein component [Methylophilaceae bacterium]
MQNFKDYKLLNPDDFSSVFNLRKRLNSPHLFLHLAPNPLVHYRLGFVIGKKTEKRAVRRNYMRRTIREVLKELLPQNFSFDIVIRVHKSFYRNDFNQIKLEVEGLIGRLVK